MAKRAPATLDLPPFPPLKRGQFHWEGEATLSSWKGYQSRRGPYAGVNSKRASDGTVAVSVAVQDSDPAEHRPTHEQGAAFQYLLDQQSPLRDAILAAILDEYPTWREEYAGDYDIEDEDELAKILPPIDRPEGLKAVIGLSTIHLLTVTDRGTAYLGFEFGCNWEEEHGLGVLTHAGRVVTVGHTDVSFTNWIAENDRKRKGRKKG